MRIRGVGQVSIPAVFLKNKRARNYAFRALNYFGSSHISRDHSEKLHELQRLPQREKLVKIRAISGTEPMISQTDRANC